ncbi:MAG: YceI family protein [Bernardetiaceae bacterium]|nr:YceI family protein [Bernardetiaceae bacterium]
MIGGYILISCFLILGVAQHVQAQRQVSAYKINFAIKNAGFTVNGTFKGLEADIKFDPEHLDKSSIKAQVEAQTIDTDNSMRDSHLRKADYFDIANYPQLSLKSKSIIQGQGKNNFNGVFDLTIKGKTKEITFPLRYETNKQGYTLKGSFAVNRLDFGVGEKSWILSNEVKISLSATVGETSRLEVE